MRGATDGTDSEVTEARSRSVLGAGVRLRVHEHGPADAPTVVLVHGYPDTSAVWHRVVARLADTHHVVTYDVRGAGGSQAPPGTARYRLDLLVGDLAAVIEAVSPHAPVHLVGHDWGAIQGFAAVTDGAASAGKVASFTAMSAPGLGLLGWWIRDRLRSPTPRHLAALAGQLRRSWYVVAFQVPVLPRLVWRSVLGPSWSRAVGGLAGHGYPAATLVDDGIRGVALYRANADCLLRPQPVWLTVPVRVVTGRRDGFVSPSVFEGLERYGDDVEVEVVDAGHWLPRSRPELIAARIAAIVADD